VLVIPEVDRGAWFTIPIARKKIFRGQEQFLDRLHAHLKDQRATVPSGASSG